MLLVYGDLSGRVAALVRARPNLIARLIVAPREAVHAIRAFLHLAPDASKLDAEVATIVNDTDPRDLLRAALPECAPRLYRALDRLLPSKKALEKHLKTRLGELFALEYDLLLYDVTSTYFEGQAERNPQAQRGYSRDQRPECKQVCIALVVSRDGLPLGYEVFAGNRADVTTVEEIVQKIEDQYGVADRIWVMDRGMISEENLEFLREQQRRYIVGTPKGQLRRFEAERRRSQRGGSDGEQSEASGDHASWARRQWTGSAIR